MKPDLKKHKDTKVTFCYCCTDMPFKVHFAGKAKLKSGELTLDEQTQQ